MRISSVSHRENGKKQETFQKLLQILQYSFLNCCSIFLGSSAKWGKITRRGVANGVHFVYRVTVWYKFSTRKRRGKTNAGLLFIYFCTQRPGLFHLVVSPEVVVWCRPVWNIKRNSEHSLTGRCVFRGDAIPWCCYRACVGCRHPVCHMTMYDVAKKKKNTVLPKKKKELPKTCNLLLYHYCCWCC